MVYLRLPALPLDSRTSKSPPLCGSLGCWLEALGAIGALADGVFKSGDGVSRPSRDGWALESHAGKTSTQTGNRNRCSADMRQIIARPRLVFTRWWKLLGTQK